MLNYIFNVYYEAGFAKGLGREVIWICRKNDAKKLHFDTRQFLHIDWEQNDELKLKEKLIDRIRATVGDNQNKRLDSRN